MLLRVLNKLLACVAGVESGMGRKGKREGDWGERGSDACYKNPLLFISADAVIRKFLIGWAVMSNLLACILACISVRDKHDEGIKEMCSTGLSCGRSKLLQSCSNFTLIACLAGRDTQEVLYTGYIQTPSGDSKWLWIFGRHLQCRYSQDHLKLFRKNIFRVEWISTNGLQRERAVALVKTICLSSLTIVYNSPFIIRV